MLHSLSMASEAGVDVIAEMSKDKELAEYKDDPRVLLLVQNAKALKAGQERAGRGGNGASGASGIIGAWSRTQTTAGFNLQSSASVPL